MKDENLQFLMNRLDMLEEEIHRTRKAIEDYSNGIDFEKVLDDDIYLEIVDTRRYFIDEFQKFIIHALSFRYAKPGSKEYMNLHRVLIMDQLHLDIYLSGFPEIERYFSYDILNEIYKKTLKSRKLISAIGSSKSSDMDHHDIPDECPWTISDIKKYADLESDEDIRELISDKYFAVSNN